MHLIIKLGGRTTMLLFDAMLSEQPILMAGQLDYSISNIIDFVLAAASMIQIPFYGVSNNVFPHVHLKEMHLLQDQPFVAGVTNPTFLLNKGLNSINCQVDQGKVTVPKQQAEYEKEKYYQRDMEFISALIMRIQQHHTINDTDIRQAFQNYAKLMWDLATQAQCF
jgi:hypothetical protein